ncbi:hypothetical protein [Pedobacter frigoris]|uniref:Lipoprotein n=1 Tax=Pedobacter frigoris TaxID=2571272 RepID=A0A4U1CIB5_9SPHI|nr:hypothetical protein [Pedobacter frigoris]TKC04397.1 hypothetical protein FA047_17590 [Pedobacter frigoris]
MKRIALALLMAGTLLACKKDRNNTDCGNKICTDIFVSATVKFVDNKGLAAEVKDYSVVNQRTGEKIDAHFTSSYYVKGSYLVVNDNFTSKLSEAGDDLKVTGTSVETNQTKSAVVKVKGGECACHIEKVSGPEQIAFN